MKKVLVVGTRTRLDEFQKLELANAEISFLDQFYVELEEVEIPFDEIEKPDDDYFIDNFDMGDYDVVIDLALDDHTRPESRSHRGSVRSSPDAGYH